MRSGGTSCSNLLYSRVDTLFSQLGYLYACVTEVGAKQAKRDMTSEIRY